MLSGIAFALGLGQMAVANCCNARRCCAESVTGQCNFIPTQNRQSDCSSYMTSTVYATPTSYLPQETLYQQGVPTSATTSGSTATLAPRFTQGIGPPPPVTPVTVTGEVPWYADTSLARDYASACSAWGITASLATVATPTTTVEPPASATCYQGAQWAFYSFTYAAAATASPGQLPRKQHLNPDYMVQYNADVFQNQTPVNIGQTSALGAWGAGCAGTFGIYGEVSTTDNTYIGLQQRGYLVPQQAGMYSFVIGSAIDDIACAWAGEAAVEGFTVGNALVCAGYSGSTLQALYLAGAGQAIPFRVQWANGGGCAEFDMKVLDPAGNIVLEATSAYGNAVLQYCVNDIVPFAPAWIPWVDEEAGPPAPAPAPPPS